MAELLSRLERIYVVGDVDGSANPIFASTAQATPGNSNYICSVRARPSGFGGSLLVNPCKTGSFSRLAGTKGRSGPAWGLTVPVQGSGAAGTAPDSKPLIEALFGKKGTVSAGVSVTYTLDDVVASVTSYSFWRPSTGSHLCAFGWVPGRFRLSSSAELATMDFDGPCVNIIDSNDFSGLTADEKGGLGSFPTEPASPASNGTPVAGFIGSITIDGTSTFSLESWSLSIDTAASLSHVLGKYVPTRATQGTRAVGLDWVIRDEDTAGLNAIKTKLRAKTAFDVTIVMGATAGNIWTWTIRGLQYDNYNYDDSANQRNMSASGGAASASSATAKNEIQLVVT